LSGEDRCPQRLPYIHALRRIHAAVLPRTYLEIGVREGTSLRLGAAADLCVGVDPEPHVTEDLPPQCRLETTTSTAFFAGPRAHELLGARPVDLAFIDGLHLFEAVLRDFMDLEVFATLRTLVVVHDCLPRDAVTSARRRSTRFWTGDVWKLVPALREARPDLRITLEEVAPSGLCLISGLRPGDASLRAAYRGLLERYLPLRYEDWEKARIGLASLTLGLDEALALHGFASPGRA
jgi:hypothetical protein